MRRLTLGTAGHIDHGKTTLVHALTGIDTDRLPEEKRRGITIDIGFARLSLDEGVELDIVDVPGHEAFVRNMLAGATGIDMALLVIAADEGVMPQTREHLSILRMLEVRSLVVALTKADIADGEWLDLVREDVAGVLAAAGYAEAPVLALSARSGAGLDALRVTLSEAARRIEPRSTADIARLPIDRVFTVRGTGTVVTGTLWSGTLSVDEQVRIEPAGLTARIRAVQRHGEPATQLHAGERGALALAGVDRHALQRGDTVLPLRSSWSPSSILTVHLHATSDAPPLQTRQRVRVHLGTAEVLARLAVADGPIAAGKSGLAQLRLETPILARAGDRLIVRAWSPVTTIGGGVVLEPSAPKRKRWSETTRQALTGLEQPGTALHALLDLAGAEGVPLDALPVLLPTGAEVPRTGAGLAEAGERDVVTAGDVAVLGRHVADGVRGVLAALESFHSKYPLEPGMEREALRKAVGSPPLFDGTVQALLAVGKVAGRDGLLALPAHTPVPGSGQAGRLAALEAHFRASGLQSSTTEELPPALAAAPDLASLLRHLERTGMVVRMPGARWAHAVAVAEGARAVISQLPAGQPLGVAEFRAVLDLSRKHLLPLLEHFDSIGVTVRQGDTRLVSRELPQGGAQPAGNTISGPDASASKS